MSNIKNIVFDLGNVLYKIDYPYWRQRWQQLADKYEVGDMTEHRPRFREIAHPYERGEMTSDKFLETMEKELFQGAGHDELKDTWNALLIGMVDDRHALIEQLSKKHKVYLLSNNNALHYEGCYPPFQKTEPLFEKTYFSHLIKRRKPEPDIYEFLFEDANIRPEESIFVDDLEENAQAAEQSGMAAIHLKQLSDLHSELQQRGLMD